VIAARILASLAALLFVIAFALAVMVGPDLPLGQAIALLRQGALAAVQNTLRGMLAPWVWLNMVVPLLLRPVWLLPAGLGLVAAGAAASVASRRNSARSRRSRRS
jgi:predicted membrane-bound spermidine synthase